MIDIPKHSEQIAAIENKKKNLALRKIISFIVILLSGSALLGGVLGDNLGSAFSMIGFFVVAGILLYLFFGSRLAINAGDVSHQFVDKGMRDTNSGLNASEFYDASQLDVQINALENGGDSLLYLSADVAHKGLPMFRTIKGATNEQLRENVIIQLRKWDEEWKARQSV